MADVVLAVLAIIEADTEGGEEEKEDMKKEVGSPAGHIYTSALTEQNN